MEYLIEFYPDNKRIRVDEKKTILDASRMLGIYLTAVCNGLEACGKCKVIVEEGRVHVKEEGILSKEEKEKKYYLACKTYPRSDLKIVVPPESRLGRHQIVEHTHDIKKRTLRGNKAGIAIDVGTTTVVGYLVDLDNKEIIDSVSSYNKQMLYGGDVLTRIHYAKKHGVDKLNEPIIETINKLIEKLTKSQGKIEIKEIVAASNTTMTYMLLNKDPGVIIKNNELPDFKKAHILNLKDSKIRCDGSLYNLPGIANYVGGDVVADIISSGMHESENVSMLIDVGTNGEIAIGNRDWLIVCSTSAGPAFEGGEVGCGMRASTGAIEKIRINEDYDIAYVTISNDKPRGICGSGFIDLLAELFLNGIIDHNGKFTDIIPDKIRQGEHGKEFIVVPGDETASGKDIKITEKDIEGIILSKAAIYAGASTLTKMGVGFMDLEKIYVAGGFGYYLNVEKAIVLGLLPDLPEERFEFIGNGSVNGAYLVLTDEEKRCAAEDIAKKATYYDLSSSKDFSREYMAALHIPHKNEELFPSVEKKL